MPRAAILAATLALIGCPAPPTAAPHPTEHDDSAVRIAIARAEARRDSSALLELAELARHGDARVLALRALGRTGGAQAIAILREALHDRDGAIVAAAMRALGLAATLGDVLPPEVTSEIVAAAQVHREAALASLEALGRVAPGPLPAITEAISDPGLAEAAALAAGRLGRRKLALDDATLVALVVASRNPSPSVRYAATYALAREHDPPLGPATPDAPSTPAPGARVQLPGANPMFTALVERVGDEQAETRATAIYGLARRWPSGTDADGKARIDVEQALRDRDWRVAVEAVRALAGEHGDGPGRDAVATAIARRYLELEKTPADAHVVIEGLRLLAAWGKQPVVASVFHQLVEASASPAIPAITRGWIECLALVGLQRMAPTPDYGAVARCHLPDHLRLPLVAELITAGAGDLAARRTAAGTLLAHADARVRAAGLGALASLWTAGDDTDHRGAISTVVAALASPDPIVAGAAVDAATAIYDAIGKAPEADRPALDAAIVARATTEQDIELSASLLEVIGKQKMASGAAACRAAALDDRRATAAVACLSALGEAAPPRAEPTPRVLPPVDVAAVIGKHLRWHLVTTRGDIVIELDPATAPWAVATIVELTRKHFYDGIEFHRVVPDFVAQGGDPTMSGTGGPGFATPAEPAGTFATGAIGMADGGKDSGGSQWFVMHAYAPHLDGRYTWVGSVESGQKSADALQIGDVVTRATIETY